MAGSTSPDPLGDRLTDPMLQAELTKLAHSTARFGDVTLGEVDRETITGCVGRGLAQQPTGTVTHEPGHGAASTDLFRPAAGPAADEHRARVQAERHERVVCAELARERFARALSAQRPPSVDFPYVRNTPDDLDFADFRIQQL